MRRGVFRLRVLKLHLKNLGSLAGGFNLDFTHPEFQNNGLFVITGPTGVGKTTILDAICLALYGRTPRLARINKSTNEIMTRGQVDCVAELTFETPAGRFRVYWAQRRARRTAAGEFQNPRHEIMDDHTDRVLEASLSRTLAAVEKITGMTFTQFTRSMMLAQGSFAAFLVASADDRAALLEQITGAELYSRLSNLAYKRWVAERWKLEDLEKEAAALIDSVADEHALQLEIQELKTRASALDRELVDLNLAAGWLKNIAKLEDIRCNLVEQERFLVDRRKKLASGLARLKAANLTLSLGVLHGERGLMRRQLWEAARALFSDGEVVGSCRSFSLTDYQSIVVSARARIVALDLELVEGRRQLSEFLAGRGLTELRAEGSLLHRRLIEVENLVWELAESERLLQEAGVLERRGRETANELEVAVGKKTLESERLATLERETEHLNARWNLQIELRNFDEWRRYLSPGEPCRLCGALEHPYADPCRTLSVEVTEADIVKNKTELKVRQKSLNELGKLEAALKQRTKDEVEAAQALIRAEKRLAKIRVVRLKVLNLTLPSGVPLAEFIRDYLTRLRDEVGRLESLICRAEELVADEAALEQEIKTRVADLERFEALGWAMAAQQEKFFAALAAAGFVDESTFERARIPEKERLVLDALARNLTGEETVLNVRQKENTVCLLTERAKNLTTRSAGELEALITTRTSDRQALSERLGVVEQTLKDLQKNALKCHELHEALLAQKCEVRPWDGLHELIGSADGKKFRNFAQSITFETLLQQANQQLVVLSDRYILTREEGVGLNLSVIDNYQAGEVRSTKNLSGGESFLVSLALALGLAQMSSQKVRVDSLFLDEGFSTLDEETLETALSALAALRHQGKLIGIISHVSVLMDRISLRISLRPTDGPHSLIIGPGVSREEGIQRNNHS